MVKNYFTIAWRNIAKHKLVSLVNILGLAIGIAACFLIMQYVHFERSYESALITILSILVSILLIVIALPSFNQLTGKNIGNQLQDLSLTYEPGFWVLLPAIFSIGSLISGIYPAFVFSSVKIVNAIKGKFFSSRSGIASRKVLVGFQFAVSIALVAGTLAVISQVSFMRKQELGYAKDQLLVIKSPLILDSTYDQGVLTFKTELLRHPAILNVAPSSEIPGLQIPHMNSLRNFDDTPESNFACYQMQIDEDFIETYGIPLLAGRNFSEGERFVRKAKKHTILLNQKAIELLGFKSAKDALHQLVYFGWGEPNHVGEIIGVLANHHQRSLRDPYDPIIFVNNIDAMGQYITIRLNMDNLPETIAFIKDQYEQSFPTNPYEQFFLDDYFDRQYAADQQFGNVFGLFSSLALIVAAMGLLGLSTFMISQRKKEIAIRKVLGATIQSMVALFSKDFIKLVVLASVLAFPLVYLMIDRWLDNFAFRIQIGWMIFVVPMTILLIISVTTVSFQTLITGADDPVKSLRSE